MNRIACVIPTYNGKVDLSRLFNSLKDQTVRFDVLVIDSSSTDGTWELANQNADHLLTIATSEFNHGGSRQLVVDSYPDYDIYVFLTQDAYLADRIAMEQILAPFADQKVGAVCGRQLPHLDATALAEHARLFNYPPQTRKKSMMDVSLLGIKTAFMSNSFAAYRASSLKGVGGFPKHVIFAEDMYVAAKMLMDGWSIVYEGSACCRHSHNYSRREEFSRYFDMGVFHAREPWIRQNFGGAGGEGFRYIKSELRYLGFRKCFLWPEALLRNAIKLLGFRLGQMEKHLPILLKSSLGMHKRFWIGSFAAGPRIK